MMFGPETVLAGAPHPGTELQVLKSAAGHYLGYLCEDGMPYSRESDYFPDEATAQDALDTLNSAIADANVDPGSLEFVR